MQLIYTHITISLALRRGRVVKYNVILLQVCRRCDTQGTTDENRKRERTQLQLYIHIHVYMLFYTNTHDRFTSTSKLRKKTIENNMYAVDPTNLDGKSVEQDCTIFNLNRFFPTRLCPTSLVCQQIRLVRCSTESDCRQSLVLHLIIPN